MKMIMRNLCAVSLLLTGVENANAVFVIDSGIDVTSQHYVIDATLSSVTYNPGTISFGSESSPPTETYGLSGSFDVNLEHHWWTYHLDGDSEGTQGTFLYSSDWLRFVNPVISSNVPPSFEFPSFASQFSNPTEFFGSNSACAIPLGPDTFCSGSNNGGIESLSGQIQNGKITFNGSQPNALSFFGGGQTYHVEASVVPVPAAFWLFASALGFFAMRARPNSKIA